MRKVLPAVVVLFLIASIAILVRNSVRAQKARLDVANAREAMQALATFQHAYQRRNGVFASDMQSLLNASGHEAQFRLLLPQALDERSLRMEVSTGSFVIEAAALDEGRTVVRIRGRP